ELDRPAAGHADSGKRLAERLGCLSCHQVGGSGQDSLFGGGDLTRIAAKRPPGFFPRWLRQPERLNPRHRMPVFPLEKKEVADLSAYLAGLGGPAPSEAFAGNSPRGDPDRG